MCYLVKLVAESILKAYELIIQIDWRWMEPWRVWVQENRASSGWWRRVFRSERGLKQRHDGMRRLTHLGPTRSWFGPSDGSLERRGSEGEGGEGRWGWDGDWAHRLATPANGDRCNGVATSARWFSSSVAAKGGLKSCKSWVKTLYVGKGDRGRLLGIQLALSKCLSKKEGE